MSKMKHLLRKLHIGTGGGGGGFNDHHNHHHRLDPSPPPHTESTSSSSPPPSAATSSADSSTSSSSMAAVQQGTRTVESTEESTDFSFFEEEFQMQLALAMSVSDPDSREDPDALQMNAAKQMSLACSPSETLIDSLSLRYWNYNFVNYDEKVMDGFYDVYRIGSSPGSHKKIPMLFDLQAISASDNVDYEVTLVNRTVDPFLHQLEERANQIYMECEMLGQAPFLDGLIQKIADLVVDRMGGPVSDADVMLKKWTFRSSELHNSLNSIVIPLGFIDVGLSRHRALLFKVLADRINLPCLLVKGSNFTGTDEGAVNLIKFSDGSEYIIDLMGAPGILVPAEVPSTQLQTSGSYISHVPEYRTSVPELSLPIKESGALVVSTNSTTGATSLEESLLNLLPQSNGVANINQQNEEERFECEFGRLSPLPCRWSKGGPTPFGSTSDSDAQKMKVSDVSRYVISAAKDPEFAQKLHAVLLESGASPPPDLFSNIDSQNMQVEIHGDLSYYASTSDNCLPCERSLVNCGIGEASKTDDKVGTNDDDKAKYDEDNRGKFLNKNGHTKESSFPLLEVTTNELVTARSAVAERISPVGEVEGWEISWEELQIGERVGIGSYGEVYLSELNGTEVAVKKFMDQDISGDALEQFKCEIEIMLRLRHPNVVLFMGAVTHPPNLSILTEYLPRGSLYKLLHRSGNQLDERRRMKMALDVAKGMNYLHTSNPVVVHRDLKTPNLLVDNNWVVKVCDFGLSRIKHHTFLSSKSSAGTPEWMAPEVLRNEQSNEKSDVYSFGVILWELATLRVPWSGMNPMQVVGAVGFQNKHLAITQDIDPTAATIILDCWQPDPQSRPCFGELLSRLKQLKHLQVSSSSSTERIRSAGMFSN
ncbi:serine/threonine-protein kinase EDR1-like [Impatiens glandulifera]|uniref:serine/threonine-protein kinase EDR1-like n=1 Tax=Impatiens glandulifera TaxID=253017 RepID=UPI001FB136BD|nr:serine/threonine-protein kinase EDR1-like [Impatiens glandulifera]